jgi:HEAT repeat protein
MRISDYESLLEKAKSGLPLGSDVIRAIRAQLSSGQFETDPYTLIHILGKANDKASAPLIRKYLTYHAADSDDAGMIRKIALQVYGRMFGKSDAFDLAERMAFEDDSPYVRIAAARILGFLGGCNESLRVKSALALLKGFHQKADLDLSTRESFYFGMLELLSIPAQEWPIPGFGSLTDDARVDEIIKRVRAIVQGQNGDRIRGEQ